MRSITARQQMILQFIIDCYRKQGYIPTMREIADRFAFRSLNAVSDHLSALERKGYILRRPGSSRGIMLPPALLADAAQESRVEPLDEEGGEGEEAEGRVSYEDEAAGATDATGKRGLCIQPEGKAGAGGQGWEELCPQQPGIPILGRVAAGRPITAVENLDGYLELNALYGAEHFALHVRGDSMIDAGIWDGDFVIVREQPRVNNGDIAVAVVEGEATVKRVRIAGSRAELIPANELYRPIIVDLTNTEFRIAGRVVGVHRVVR